MSLHEQIKQALFAQTLTELLHMDSKFEQNKGPDWIEKIIYT